MRPPERQRPFVPRRAGPRRVVVHIVLFALLGALAMGLGLYGRDRLISKAAQLESGLLVDALLDGATARVRALLVADDAPQTLSRAVDTGISSKKRLLKEEIARLVGEDAPNADIARLAADTLAQGALARAGEEDRPALQEKYEAGAAEAASSLSEAADQLERGFSLGQVRLNLVVTEPYYPLMYYYAPLLALGAFLLAFALALGTAYLRGDVEKRARVGQRLEPMDYLLPFFLGVLVFTLYPMVRVVIMSFQERYRLDGSFLGWGLGNYEYVLKGIPGTTNYFLQGLSNTVLYVLYTVPLATALAIVIAYLLNQKLRLSALFQTGYFLPMVTSVTAVGLVWRWIFNRNFGVLNAILGWFGIAPVNWLHAASNSMLVMVIFGVWSSLPFTIILLLSGLQNIDETYYTVARVDGARATRIFRRITVPLLAPTISLVLIINSISAFKVFTEVKVLFGGYPGPVLNMFTMVYYIYDMMYEYRELGRAAAAAIVLFVFILAFTMLQRWSQRRWRYE